MKIYKEIKTKKKNMKFVFLPKARPNGDDDDDNEDRLESQTIHFLRDFTLTNYNFVFKRIEMTNNERPTIRRTLHQY